MFETDASAWETGEHHQFFCCCCFAFFSCSKLVLQITTGFVYATLVTESARVPSTNDLLKNIGNERVTHRNSESRQRKMY